MTRCSPRASAELQARDKLVQARPFLGIPAQVFDLVMAYYFDCHAALVQASQAGVVEEVKDVLRTGHATDHALGAALTIAAGAGCLPVVAVLLDALMRAKRRTRALLQAEAERLFGVGGAFHAAITSLAGPQFQVIGYLLLQYTSYAVLGSEVWAADGDGGEAADVILDAAGMEDTDGHGAGDWDAEGTADLPGPAHGSGAQFWDGEGDAEAGTSAVSPGTHVRMVDAVPAEFIPESAFDWLTDLPQERGWYVHALSCWPALHVACFFRLPAHARALLNAGADPGQSCLHGTTPVSLACDRLGQNPNFRSYHHPPPCPELNLLLNSHAHPDEQPAASL